MMVIDLASSMKITRQSPIRSRQPLPAFRRRFTSPDPLVAASSRAPRIAGRASSNSPPKLDLGTPVLLSDRSQDQENGTVGQIRPANHILNPHSREWGAPCSMPKQRRCNAGRYERTEARRDMRAGSYSRKLQTQAGEVN
jgi:hypothetical protein